jgi:hypothetical protein
MGGRFASFCRPAEHKGRARVTEDRAGCKQTIRGDVMKKKSRGLAARASALEKAVVKMFSGKKAKAKKRKKAAAPTKTAKTNTAKTKIAKTKKTAKKIKTIKKPKPKPRKKASKTVRRKKPKSPSTAPTLKELVPGGEPLFVTPMDQV